MIPEHIKNFPKMCEEAIEIGKKVELKNFPFNKIAACGLGGSGAAGDVLADLLRYNFPIDVTVVKSYHLPAHVDKDALVFCISYSGNTEETLSTFVEAIKRNCKIISVTSGGKLKEWSEKLGVTLVLIPKGYQPRDALPYMLLPAVICLQKLGAWNFEKDLKEAVDVVKSIGLNDLDKLDKIADQIKNSDVAIYGTDDLTGVVRRFKNEFNENAKIVVKYDYFPELNHNEINGYERNDPKRTAILILRTDDEGEEIKSRIEVTKEVLKNHWPTIYEIWSHGESKLAKIISFMYIASYLTAKIAELVGINREQVILIDRIKEGLKNRLNLVERLEKNLF